MHDLTYALLYNELYSHGSVAAAIGIHNHVIITEYNCTKEDRCLAAESSQCTTQLYVGTFVYIISLCSMK